MRRWFKVFVTVVALAVVIYLTGYAMATRVIDCASVCESNGWVR